jgi:Cys-tRNA(Pro)/Cys-tRNA(Cys) deacylase
MGRRGGLGHASMLSPARYSRRMTDQPRTPAIEALEVAGIPFTVMRTEIARSAEESAAFQGIPVGSLLRSILVRRAQDDFLFVLVPGGRRFNWPKLRHLLGTNRLTLPTEEEAKAETGYVRGAITPFGARRPWPVIADASIEGLHLVAIGGGARGVNVHLAPADLIRATDARVVDITVPEPPSTEAPSTEASPSEPGPVPPPDPAPDPAPD